MNSDNKTRPKYLENKIGAIELYISVVSGIFKTYNILTGKWAADWKEIQGVTYSIEGMLILDALHRFEYGDTWFNGKWNEPVLESVFFWKQNYTGISSKIKNWYNNIKKMYKEGEELLNHINQHP